MQKSSAPKFLANRSIVRVALSTAVRSSRELFADDVAAHLRTPRDFIRFSTSKLRDAKVAFGQGSSSATADAIWLVLGTLNLPLTVGEDGLFLDANLTPDEAGRILHNLRRRIDERIPTGYIINRAIFDNYEFYVDERTIIPRSCPSENLRRLSLFFKDSHRFL